MEDEIKQFRLAILPQFDDVINPTNERGENSFYYKRYFYEWEKQWRQEIKEKKSYNPEEKDLALEFLKKQILLLLDITRLFRLVNRYKESNPALLVKISIAKGDIEQRLEGISYFEYQLKKREIHKEFSLAQSLQSHLLFIWQQSINTLKANAQINIHKSPLALKFKEAEEKLEKAVNKENIDRFLQLKKLDTAASTDKLESLKEAQKPVNLPKGNGPFTHERKQMEQERKERLDRMKRLEQMEKDVLRGTVAEENPHPQVFVNRYAFLLFDRLYHSKKESLTPLAEFSFIYRRMWKDDLLQAHQKPEVFRDWLAKEPYEIVLDNKFKTLSNCKTNLKEEAYQNAKQLIKEQTDPK